MRIWEGMEHRVKDFEFRIANLRDCRLRIVPRYVSHSTVITPFSSSDLNSGSPVTRGHLLIMAKAAAKQSAYEIG